MTTRSHDIDPVLALVAELDQHYAHLETALADDDRGGQPDIVDELRGKIEAREGDLFEVSPYQYGKHLLSIVNGAQPLPAAQQAITFDRPQTQQTAVQDFKGFGFPHPDIAH